MSSFYFLIPIILQGQQRLTDFKSVSSNNYHFLRTFEGTSYLLTINQSNDLNVFKLSDENTSELLYTNNFQGIFDGKENKRFSDNYILFSEADEFVEYDFVNNEIIKTRLPENYNFSNFSGFHSKNRFFFAIKTLDQSDTKGKVYELGGKIYDYESAAIIGIVGDYLIDRRIPSQHHDQYFVYNIISEEDTLLAEGRDLAQDFLVLDDHFLFYKNDGSVNKFNFLTGLQEPLGDLEINLDLLNSCLLYTSPSPRDATLSRMPSSA